MKPNPLRGIYLRGNTYWLAQQVNKKRSYVSLETGDMAEAIKKAADIRGADVLDDGSALEHVVDRYIAHCVRTGEWTASTADSKSPVIKKWAKAMGDVTPGSVTTGRIQAWHAGRLKDVTASTAYGNLMMLQGFFRWCIHSEKCARDNPVHSLTNQDSPKRIKAPAPTARKDFCTAELRDKLIAECPREDLKYVLFCGFHAGMRFQEIVESKAFWFDMKEKQLHLRKHAGIQFKDREERAIPMTKDFHAFLTGYGLHEPYMLHPEVVKGAAIYRWDFGRPFSEYMTAQGVPWVTPHIMRHTFASLLASAGVSIFHIAVWLGDGVRVTERHYAKLTPMHVEIERGFSPPPAAKPPRPPRKRASSKRRTRRSQKA